MSDYGRVGRKAARLRQVIHEALLARHHVRDELPTSNRFLLYELRGHDPALYGHTSRRQGRAEDQNVSDATMWLRKEGIVPFDWIEDERRAVTAYEYATSVHEYLLSALSAASINP